MIDYPKKYFNKKVNDTIIILYRKLKRIYKAEIDVQYDRLLDDFMFTFNFSNSLIYKTFIESTDLENRTVISILGEFNNLFKKNIVALIYNDEYIERLKRRLKNDKWNSNFSRITKTL